MDVKRIRLTSRHTCQTLAGLVRRRHPSKFQGWAALLYQPSYNVAILLPIVLVVHLTGFCKYQACRVLKDVYDVLTREQTMNVVSVLYESAALRSSLHVLLIGPLFGKL